MTSFSTLALKLRRSITGEQGQTLVEYALLIALMSIALTAVLFNFGAGVDGLYGVIQDVIDAL
jgi:Flp pilus assembly pilin Flp